MSAEGPEGAGRSDGPGGVTGRAPRADPAVALQAALAVLLSLALAMFAASLAGTVPSPPHDKLPFVAANIALVVAALVLAVARHAASGWVAAIAALSFLPSVGPHKMLTEPHAQALTPVIVLGTAAVVATWLAAWSQARALRAARAAGQGSRAPDASVPKVAPMAASQRR